MYSFSCHLLIPWLNEAIHLPWLHATFVYASRIEMEFHVIGVAAENQT